MSNEASEIGLVHFVVDVTDENDLNESLMACIDMDNDLTENEDFFQDDTLELGFESEADRVISEALEDDVDLSTLEGVTKLFKSVTSAVEDQDYFGECSLDIIELGYNKFAVAFAYGGE